MRVHQKPSQFPLKLNFLFYQGTILALMSGRQLKGQQVPLAAFCQGFLTCLWIRIPGEEADLASCHPEDSNEFENVTKSIRDSDTPSHPQRGPITAM
jgi:hypothetical protein